MPAIAGEGAERLGDRRLAGLGVAVRADQKKARIAKLVREELQEEKRRCVRPLQIVQHENDRSPLGGALEERHDGIEEIEPRMVRLQRDGRRSEVRQQLAHLRYQLHEGGGAGSR